MSLSLPCLSEICIVIPSFGLGSDIILLTEWTTFHVDAVMQFIEHSVTAFSLQIGGIELQSRQILPDLWIDGKKLYRYQPLDGGVTQSYQLSYHKPPQSHVYDEYKQDNTAIMQTVVRPAVYFN